MKKDSSYLVALDGCHHTPVFARAHLPSDGEEVWCLRCQAYRRVESVVGMFRAVCRDCRFTRWHGAARLNAQRDGDRHVRACKSHTVDVWLGETRLSTHMGAEVHAEQLTMDGALFDPPPF